MLVDLAKGEQNAPEFVKLNPNHRVPVLVDNNFVLWESYAIMQYLADITPGQNLYPTDTVARADVNRWLFWCGQDFMPGITLLNWENKIKALIGLEPADPVEVGRGERLLTESAAVLDAHLADKKWICDSGLSLADYAVAAPLADQHRAKFPVTELHNIQRWLNQIQELETWIYTEADNIKLPENPLTRMSIDC